MSPFSFSIAPMMAYTHRYYRYLMRLVAPNARLYTEMVTTAAIKHNKARAFLRYHPQELPLALQIGGSDPKECAEAAKVAEDLGYSEINLNVGCPSARVQQGAFGACLFKQPAKVADCIAAMKACTSLAVTVKTRIAVDDYDDEACLMHFAESVMQAGCERLIVHARKAWLKGLSPKQNRHLPALNYDRVWQLKKQFPYAVIEINGGLTTLSQMLAQQSKVDGIMIGRAAVQQPWLLRQLQQTLHADTASSLLSLTDCVQAYVDFVTNEAMENEHYKVVQPLFSLLHGNPGAKHWRRQLACWCQDKKASWSMLKKTVAMIA